MNTTPNPEAFKAADPALITALAAQQDAGHTAPGWAELGKTLGRDASNVRKSGLALAKAGLIELDPFTVSEQARILAAAWQGAPLPGERRSPGRAAVPSGEQAIAHCYIHASPLNPRKSFDAEELDALADDIATNGLLQNIVLRPWPAEPGHYEIAGGERRWRAVGRLIERGEAQPDYPMRALVRELTDQELLLIALSENANRVDPPPMEEARGLAQFREMRVAEILAEIYKGDPIAKGFTADQITPETRQAIGTANEEAARAMGKSTRWVQLRLKLATDLAEPLQAALAEGQISLAQARAIVAFPPERQINALDSMIKGWGGWGTAEGIIREMRAQGLPVSEAGFDPASYDGETMEDPETGEIIMLDRGLITSLQMAALKARAKALEAEGSAAFVDTPDSFSWDKYETGRRDGPCGPGEGWVVTLEDLRIVVRSARRAGRAPATKTTTEGEPAPETAQPFGRRHWLQSAADRAARLRTAIAHAGPAPALAIAIIALLPRGMEYNVPAPHSWIASHRTEGDDKTIPAAPELAERLGEIITACQLDLGWDAEEAFGINRNAVVVKHPARALQILCAQSAECLTDLLAAAIANQAGVWPGYNPAPGCDGFTAALASQLEPHLPAFEMTSKYLATFTAAQRRKIAAAAGIPAGEIEAMPAKAADAIAWIIAHPARDPAWCPPEMHFTSADATERAVAAMLAGEAGASEGGEG
ncbi:ParB/RepB/Spo0J family partition protein [Maricaulis sp.]|uniref:ParB/RepB/Spo0J family partition protein n=1 Tax=Maricaulis sp. TaxID=1486257 RepID=UPI003A95832D